MTLNQQIFQDIIEILKKKLILKKIDNTLNLLKKGIFFMLFIRKTMKMKKMIKMEITKYHIKNIKILESILP